MLEDKSDNLISMKKVMTATEVARNFSDVLDAVVNGDEITITRGNKPIAVLGSVKEEVPNSLLLAEALKKHFEKHNDVPIDESFDATEYIRQMRDESLERDLERDEFVQSLLNRPRGEEGERWSE